MANNSAFRYQDFSKTATAVSLERVEGQFPALPLPALNCLPHNSLSRSAVAQVSGRRSSGRTSIALYALAQATGRGEICAVIDLYDSFHPASGDAAGIQLDRILWVRCHGNAEHALRATDLLLHAGGFGVVLLDLCDAAPRVLNRIPLSYWYRFRRAVEHTPAILLICADSPQANSCILNGLELEPKAFHWSGKPPFLRLHGIEAQATLRRTTAQRMRAASPLSIQALA